MERLRTVVTFIHGPKGSGKTRLANRFAEERRRANYTCKIVDANGQSVEELSRDATVNYLYICSLKPPTPADARFLFVTLPIGMARAVA